VSFSSGHWDWAAGGRCGPPAPVVSYRVRGGPPPTNQLITPSRFAMRAFTTLLRLPWTLLAFTAPGAEPAQVYRGATVLTVTRGEVADADFVVQDGKFLAVGKRAEV